MIDLLTADFFLIALAAGLGLAIVCGPLGSLVVWRRMSYFGDTLAHSALLGVALGLILDINSQLSILVSCVIFALLLLLLQRKSTLPIDTLLGIVAHSTLALGVVVLSLTDSIRVNLEAYLFGDLLTINGTDLGWILLICVLVLIVICIFWNQILSTIVHPELAEVEGISVKKIQLVLILTMAVTIAVSMKVVGVLLITSLLIVPAAAARQISNTPEKMAFSASFIGCFSVVSGLLLSFFADTPAGPTIVVVATTVFLCLYFRPSKFV